MIHTLTGIDSTASALSAERVRMEVITQNIANANTTRGLNGKPYQRLVFNPGHPEADAEGMVAMPNVNIHEEMADLIAASRAFEANLAVVKNARSMALQ